MKTRYLVWLLLPASLVGCSRKVAQGPPVAAVSVSLAHSRVPLGSPVEVKYRFVVAPQAKIDGDYRVFVHFLDAAREMMWTDDHVPAVPTSQWKPGQTIEYSRTMWAPVYPYTGEATVEVGLYQTNGKRLWLSGAQDRGHQSYEVARFEMVPQTENIFLIYRDGWYPVEVSPDNPANESQWTKKDAVIAFHNPKRNVLLYLQVDGLPTGVEPPTTTVRIGDQVVDRFVPSRETLRKVPLTAAQLGSGEMTELKISVDRTFVPALVPALNSEDSRELGVRVFHAFVEAQ
jgi:hypothetical protein